MTIKQEAVITRNFTCCCCEKPLKTQKERRLRSNPFLEEIKGKNVKDVIKNC